jgi:hypothetical protein
MRWVKGLLFRYHQSTSILFSSRLCVLEKSAFVLVYLFFFSSQMPWSVNGFWENRKNQNCSKMTWQLRAILFFVFPSKLTFHWLYLPCWWCCFNYFCFALFCVLDARCILMMSDKIVSFTLPNRFWKTLYFLLGKKNYAQSFKTNVIITYTIITLDSTAHQKWSRTSVKSEHKTTIESRKKDGEFCKFLLDLIFSRRSCI